MSEPERRCPTCGALVGAEAEWCGQCFSSLRVLLPPPPPTLEPAQPDTASQDVRTEVPQTPKADAFWPCSVCGATNPIEREVCDTCGTPFAAVMRGAGRRRADPEAARRRSLLFPGAGHSLLGYPIDGFARGALFALSLGLAVLLIVATPHAGPALLAIVLTLGLAIGVYVLSVLEIPDLATHGRLIVPSKFLLWGGVVVMFLVVGAIALSVATSARR